MDSQSSGLFYFVITRRPSDHPGSFVVRQWFLEASGVQTSTGVSLHPDLKAARSVIPLGYYRLEPDRTDDPVIVESWV
jgi:hypothetical protein